MDNITIIYPENDAYIQNLAFIRALLLKESIENLNISLDDKKIIFQNVLQYLRDNPWFCIIVINIFFYIINARR